MFVLSFNHGNDNLPNCYEEYLNRILIRGLGIDNLLKGMDLKFTNICLP